MADTTVYQTETPVADSVARVEENVYVAKAEAEQAVANAANAVVQGVEVAAEEFRATANVPSPVAPATKNRFYSIVEANPAYPKLKALALWRDPTNSALVFGIATCTYILLHWFDYTIVSILGYLAFALLVLCFGYTQYVYIRGTWLRGAPNTENPFVSYFRDYNFKISKDDAKPHLDTLLDMINFVNDRHVNIFFCVNRWLSLKYIAYFYVTAIVGQWFSGLTLAYFAVLAFFVWPRLYQEKHVEIDNAVEKLNVEFQKYTELAYSKLPPQIKQYTGFDAKKKRM